MMNAKYGSSKKTYWYDEKVIFNEDFLKNIRDVDVLVTHTCQISVYHLIKLDLVT
jgi:hypothetical protein